MLPAYAGYRAEWGHLPLDRSYVSGKSTSVSASLTLFGWLHVETLLGDFMESVKDALTMGERVPGLNLAS